MNIYLLLLKLCENERRYYILIFKFERAHYFLSYLIFFKNFRTGFSDGPPKIVPRAISVFAHPAPVKFTMNL